MTAWKTIATWRMQALIQEINKNQIDAPQLVAQLQQLRLELERTQSYPTPFDDDKPTNPIIPMP